MAWWPYLWTNMNTHQDVLGTVDRTHLLSYSLVLMPINFLFSQELFQTGTPFPVQPDQHHLWTPSRRPYTVYLASPIVITEPCHSSSNGCTPMAGYSLKNWNVTEDASTKLWKKALLTVISQNAYPITITTRLNNKQQQGVLFNCDDIIQIQTIDIT